MPLLESPKGCFTMRWSIGGRLALLSMAGLAAWGSGCATDAGLGEDDGPGAGGALSEGGLEGGDGSGSGGASAAGGAGGTSGTSGTGGGDASAWPGSGVGDPCSTDSECGALDCIDGKCTFACRDGTGCPSGAYCSFHPTAGYVCVPSGSQCTPCTTAADCPNGKFGDRCAIAPKTDRFCSQDCSFDGTCPAGFSCADVATYAGSVAGGGGGAPAGDAGAPKSEKMCVPATGESCACDTKRDGVTRTCEATSGMLTCGGTETCEGASGTWGSCTAGTPSPEVCDGADNDCNGTADDADVATMCAGAGNPANATWACETGQCVVGGCTAGYTNYPATLPPSAGCPCRVDATEPNETCADAKQAGSVTDANTTPLVVSGRLSSDGDVDWYRFDTTDAAEAGTNSYHIRIRFTAPVPNNDEFVFDVIRGDTCATPDAKHSNLTEYDWCVDGTGTDASGKTIGEATCSDTGAIHCGPHTKPYLVAVRRKNGATGTCSQYQLGITAKGGGACDFTQATGACDAQVAEN